jgi:hypothetical protein
MTRRRAPDGHDGRVAFWRGDGRHRTSTTAERASSKFEVAREPASGRLLERHLGQAIEARLWMPFGYRRDPAWSGLAGSASSCPAVRRLERQGGSHERCTGRARLVESQEPRRSHSLHRLEQALQHRPMSPAPELRPRRRRPRPSSPTERPPRDEPNRQGSRGGQNPTPVAKIRAARVPSPEHDRHGPRPALLTLRGHVACGRALGCAGRATFTAFLIGVGSEG